LTAEDVKSLSTGGAASAVDLSVLDVVFVSFVTSLRAVDFEFPSTSATVAKWPKSYFKKHSAKAVTI